MPASLRFDAAAATDPGWRHRENQDAVLLGAEVLQGSARRSLAGCATLLAAVADGLAHAPCASRASRMVLEELASFGEDMLRAGVARSIQQRMASRAAGTRCEGMSSTLAAMQLSDEVVRVVSVGDTRVYLWREESLRQVTEDHTIARRMVREGDLTPEQAREAGSLYADLDSALVASSFEDRFDVFGTTVAPLPGDCWLCLSDGIHGALPDAGIAALLASMPDAGPDRIVAALLEAAGRNRASDDNLSAVAVRAWCPES